MKKNKLNIIIVTLLMTLCSCAGVQGETGPRGENGLTPNIGYNGNWWIGNEDTGVPAIGVNGSAGADGNTPYIGENGNWWIGEQDTGVRAEGKDGQNGKDGQDGKDGSTLLTGNGEPSSDLGKEGDSYIDLDTWDFYVKNESGWEHKGKIKGDSEEDNVDYYGTEGLEFYPINDNECAVSVGNAKLLKDIVIPSKYKNYTVVELLNFSFSSCNNLINISMPNTIKKIGVNSFNDCYNLMNFYYDGNIGDWCKINFQNYNCNPMTYIPNIYFLDDNGKMQYNENKYSLLSEVTIPRNISNINSYTFYGCKSLISVSLPDSLEKIGHSAFEDCINLKCIEFPNSLKEIGASAFEGCESLVSLSLPDSLELINTYAFYKCSNLISIIIPNTVIIVGEHLFMGCPNIKVYCEFDSKPEGWPDSWYEGKNVYWAGQWEFDEYGNPKPINNN